jgi:hypothetical protein
MVDTGTSPGADPGASVSRTEGKPAQEALPARHEVAGGAYGHAYCMIS